LFGWKIEKAEVKKDGDSMDYWMISTSGVSNDKSLGGGIMKRQDPQQPNLNYIGVDSIDEYSRKIGELGGKVVMPKTEISDYGYFAVCMDTENNAFALWEHIDPGQR
jgi:predicted enzyme related to lactoylglutathione lyase